MPPLFVYAIAFLVVLTIVTFVLCHRADAGEKAQTAPAAAPPLRERPAPAGSPPRPSPEPLRRIAPASAPARREPDGGGSSPFARSGRAADAGAAHPSLFAPAGRTAATGAAAAADLLGLQLAELARQVAELQAERQTVQDEIRRLRATVADMTAPTPVRPLRPVRLVEAEPRLHRIGG